MIMTKYHFTVEVVIDNYGQLSTGIIADQDEVPAEIVNDAISALYENVINS